MGHSRLGELPNTRPWQQVVGLLADYGDASSVAAATMEAAQGGLALAEQDTGLQHSVYLLTQIVGAAKGKYFVEQLREAGLVVEDKPGVFAITSAFSQAVDDHVAAHGGCTDVGELAQLAAVEVLASSIADIRCRPRSWFVARAIL